MKMKPLFIQLGFNLASVDTTISLYDSEQLLSKHIHDIDIEIEPMLKQHWETDWSVFYKVLLLEYKKSELSNQIYVVEERKKLIETLTIINSSPDISNRFKNGYLYKVFQKSWELTWKYMLKESTKEFFSFDN